MTKLGLLDHMADKISKDIDLDELLDRVMVMAKEDEMAGICLACLEDAYCEPDAECYACESCGARMVYGFDNLLLMMVA